MAARGGGARGTRRAGGTGRPRSEEHTSELQSPCNLVCRLLLEKKRFMVCANFAATICRGLVSLTQVIKEFICLHPLYCRDLYLVLLLSVISQPILVVSRLHSSL